MNTYGKVDVQLRIILISEIVDGKSSATRPGRFIPGERALDTQCIKDLCGLQILSRVYAILWTERNKIKQKNIII
jgi:hypothetical protein